tara:strand:- start:341 stop:589 length:249 start_codon:yes stop_codon:yes gene_type:complete
MSNHNSMISKYNDYDTKHHQDVPGGKNIIGILENETIEDVFRVFGGTVNDTPHVVWTRVSDAVHEYLGNHNVIDLQVKRTLQ